MYIPDIYQNDRDEKLNQKKFTLTITLTVTRQERNFHCNRLNSNLNHFDLNEQNNDSFDDDIVVFTCKICKMNLRLEQISDFDDHARKYHFKTYKYEIVIVRNDRSELLNLINLRKISN